MGRVMVPYEEMDGSPEEVFGHDEFRATVRIMVPWNRRYDAVDAMMYSRYPRRPDYPAFCWHVGIQSFGQCLAAEDVASMTAFDKAILTATYSTKNPSAEDLYTEELIPTMRFLTEPSEGLYWDDGSTDKIPVTAEQAQGRPMMGAIYRLNRFLLTEVPDWTDTLLGKTNASAYTVRTPGLSRTYAPQTLVFQQPKISRAFKVDGTYKFNIGIELEWKPNRCPLTGKDYGWNYFWRPRVGTFQRMVRLTGYTTVGEGEDYREVPDYEPYDPFPPDNFNQIWS